MLNIDFLKGIRKIKNPRLPIGDISQIFEFQKIPVIQVLINKFLNSKNKMGKINFQKNPKAKNP